jgi:Tol biopolymer transport system component
MDDPAQRLMDLAAAVGDGTPDWSTAPADDDPEARGVVDHLRTIARIASLHSRRTQAATSVPAAPGSWGPLEVIEWIGAARFGDVYRAFDPALHRTVALKILRHPQQEDDEVIEEGRLAARIRHPHVVTIFGATCVDGRAGLWMELIEGQTLEAELADRGPFAALSLIEVGVVLSDALDAVHAAGCVHRDVKTTNVMRDKSGRLVLGDFGTGHEWSEDAPAAGLAGTPAYLAPELFERLPATPRSDIYSLGVLLFRLATAEFPVSGRTLGDVHASHARGTRTRLIDRRPDLPRSLSTAIERAMDPDPSLRFQTGAAMAAALGRRTRRRIVAVATLAASTVMFAGIARWAGWLGRPTTPVHEGVSLVQLDTTWTSRAPMLGPPVGDVMPCSARQAPKTGLAICNLSDRSISLVREGPAPATATGAVLLPDGRRFVYVWPAKEPRTWEIRVTDRAGRDDRVLYTSTASVRLHKWLAASGAVYFTRGTDALLLPLDGSGIREVGSIGSPDAHHDLSPDGRLLVVTQRAPERGARDLIATDVAGGQVLWEIAGPSDDFLPVWTPDGGGLVFGSDRFGGQSLVYLNRANTARPDPAIELRALGRTSIRHPAGFSTDGAFCFTGLGPARTLYLADFDLASRTIGSPRVVEPATVDDTLGGDWSPDGRQFAYFRTRLNTSGPAVLVIRNVDGSLARELPVNGQVVQVNNRVRWSPDGKQLAITRGLINARAIDIYDIVSGTSRTWLEGGEFWDPQWVPGSSGIAYFTEVRGGGTTKAEIRTAPGAAHGDRSAILYGPADGRLLAGGFDHTPSGGLLMRIQVPGGPFCQFRVVRVGVTRDFPFPDPACPGAAWIGDGPWFLASVKPSAETGALWLVNADSGERHRLTLQSDLVFFLSLNKTRTSLLFTAGNPPPITWKLTGIPPR